MGADHIPQRITNEIMMERGGFDFDFFAFGELEACCVLQRTANELFVEEDAF